MTTILQNYYNTLNNTGKVVVMFKPPQGIADSPPQPRMTYATNSLMFFKVCYAFALMSIAYM